MNDEQLEVEQIEVLPEEGAATVYQEIVIVEDRPFYTTPFTDYSVSEGLLLLIFVILLVEFFLNLIRRWF